MVEGSSGGSRRRWRRWGAAFGGLLVLVAGGLLVDQVRERYAVPTDDLFDGTFGPSPPQPTPSPTPEPGADITGPLDILMVGIDSRPGQPGWQPHADAVLILHVTEALDQAYLFSLPRDLVLEIPAFDEADFSGGTYRLLSAMTYGSRVPGEDLPDTAQGFALLAETVSRYTGIDRFDAGAVLNFPGFTDLVDAIGGVAIRLDLQVASQHREPDGTHRAPAPGGGGYVGPQQVYEPGVHELVGWQALDIARQRYLPDGDYTRTLHQRRLIQALVQEIAEQGLMTDPIGLDRVLRAVGDALVFDGRGHRVVDFAFALGELGAGSLVPVTLPGRSLFSGGAYQGEQLEPVGEEFFAAVREDAVEAFLAGHAELVDPR